MTLSQTRIISGHIVKMPSGEVVKDVKSSVHEVREGNRHAGQTLRNQAWSPSKIEDIYVKRSKKGTIIEFQKKELDYSRDLQRIRREKALDKERRSKGNTPQPNSASFNKKKVNHKNSNTVHPNKITKKEAMIKIQKARALQEMIRKAKQDEYLRVDTRKRRDMAKESLQIIAESKHDDNWNAVEEKEYAPIYGIDSLFLDGEIYYPSDDDLFDAKGMYDDRGDNFLEKEVGRSFGDFMNFQSLLEGKGGLSSVRDWVVNFKPFSGFPMMNKQFTSCMAFLWQLYRASNVLDYAAAVNQFVLNLDLGDWDMQKLINKLTSAVEKYYDPIRISSIIKTESLLDMSEGAYTFLNLILSSELTDALKSILISVTSFHLFDKDVSKKIYYTLGKPPRGPLVQVIHSIFTSILTLMRCGESVLKGESIMESLFSPDPVTKIIHDTKILEGFKNSLYTGLPSPGKKCLREFVKECSDNLVMALKAKSLINPYKDKGKELGHAILTLENMLNIARQRVEGGHRPTPYGIIFHGFPGIGKSKLVPFANDCMAKVHGRTSSGLSTIFAVEKDSDYMEGYDPYSHPTLFYSEMGVMSKALAAKTGDPRISSLTSMVDSLPKIAPMAFEDKGKIYVLPELVIGDTNNEDLNLKEIVYAPAAVQRRFTWVEPIVKEQFRKDDGVSIDAKKSKEYDDLILDRWYFNVYTVNVESNMEGTRVYHLRASKKHDIYDLRKFLVSHMREHVKHEHEMVSLAQGPDMYNVYDERPEDQKIDAESFDVVTDVAKNRFVEGSKNIWNNMKRGYRYVKFKTKLTVREKIEDTRILCTYVRHCSTAVKNVFKTMVKIYFLKKILKELDEKSRDLNMFVFNYLRLGLFFILCLFFLFNASFLMCLSMITFINGKAVLLMVTKGQVSKVIALLENDRAYHERYLGYMLGFEENFNVFESKFWVKHKKVLMAGIAATGAAVAALELYKRYARERPHVEMSSNFFQRNEASVDIQRREDEEYKCDAGAIRVKGKGKNIWENNIRHLSEPCKFTSRPEDLSKLVWKNTRRIRINSTSYTHCIGVCQDIVMFNKHAIMQFLNETDIHIEMSPSGLEDCEDLREWMKFVVKSRNVLMYDNDVAFVRLLGSQFRNLVQHFSPDENFSNVTYGYIESARVYPTFKRSNVTINHKGRGKFTLKSVFEYVWSDHRDGACGMPLIINKDQGSCIAGIHVGSDAISSFSIPLIRDFVSGAISKMNSDSKYMSIVSENSDRKIKFEDPARKSPFMFEKFNGLKYYGKDEENIKMNLKSKVTYTPIAKDVPEIFKDVFNYTSDKVFGPPVMKPFLNSAGDYISPYNLALNKIAKSRSVVNEDITDVVLDVLVDHVVARLKERGVTTISPNTMEQAINGINHDDFMGRMNSSTSAGYGYPGKKSEHVPIVDEKDSYVIREATPELMAHLRIILDAYERDESVEFVYSARLKDEAREYAKIIVGKTRVFYMSPITAVILYRMFLSPFYTLMVEYGDIFCTAIGVNMHTDADCMVEEMCAFSNEFIEGDYGTFDQTMPFGISMTASTATYRICSILGYSGKALKIVKGLLSDGLYPWVEMLRDVFVAPGLQVSGKVCTAEDNSWKGLVMLMYAWYKDEKLRKHNFFDGVKPLTYGDDVFAGVKKKYQVLFNNFSYKKVVEEDFGMTFTPAIKDSNFKQFMNVNNVSFLKRNFVYNKEHGRWLAPLDMSAIVRAMTWHVPSAFLSKDIQTMDACTSMAWEVFLHADEKKYDIFRTKVVETLVSNTDLERHTVVNAIPLYGEIAEKIFS